MLKTELSLVTIARATRVAVPDERISHDFSANAGARDLEVFLMKDEARRRFREMEKVHAKDRERLAAARTAEREENIRKAAHELRNQRQAPEHRPFWHSLTAKQREANIQREARRCVDSQDAAVDQEMKHQQRAREDEYIALQRDERLQREANERAARDPSPPEFKRDFDRAR
jgi:hypothetical protein